VTLNFHAFHPFAILQGNIRIRLVSEGIRNLGYGLPTQITALQAGVNELIGGVDMSTITPYKARDFNLSGLTGISDETLDMHFKLYEGYV
jgi:hypothetical protein